jgi:enoyl-CoA hydratase/carnithine racemase
MPVIEVSIDGSRAGLLLNRPDVLNAFDFDMFDTFPSAIDEIAQSDARICVVSGAGRAFSSGIDVGAFGSISAAPKEMVARAQAGFRRLAALEIPTIAAVHGYAYGAGLQVTLACDLRVMASNASVGLLEIDYGLIPDLGGSTTLPRLVGPGRAKKMILTAERIDGTEAERIGLAEIVVAAHELDAAVKDVVDKVLSSPVTPLREAKALIDRAHLLDAQEGMDAEAGAQVHCLTDPGFGEAVAAGLRKRARKD